MLNLTLSHCNTCILLQGEDEAVFLEFRGRLKVLFDNIALLVSEISTMILMTGQVHFLLTQARAKNNIT